MEGYNTHRHLSNPKEKEIHDKFIEHFFSERFNNKNILDRIVFGYANSSQTIPKKFLTEEENKICVTLAQWFGSPAGQGFLSDCCFECVFNIKINTSSIKFLHSFSVSSYN